MTDSIKIFGYGYSDEKLKGIRDIFLNAATVYFYRLNKGEKAECKFATAKYSGERGNDIEIYRNYIHGRRRNGYTGSNFHE